LQTTPIVLEINMQVIDIYDIKGTAVLEQLNTKIQGTVSEEWGEYVLEFNNDKGQGIIRSITFDWGVTLIDYDVNFNDDTKIIFHLDNSSPVEFIFVSEGELTYVNGSEEESQLQRYQNIIITAQKGSQESYIFPKKVAIKVNFIYVVRKDYLEKKNNNIPTLNDSLKDTFGDTSASASFSHHGNFSLKIADQIKLLQESHEHGMIRTLSIEGQLNLIMAMQMLEHNNHEKGVAIPESLSRQDIKKIHDLSAYIVDNIEESLTVEVLSQRSGLSHRKLQLGFRVLYTKSVNEHVRQMKLEIARDLLMTSDKNVSEIVYAVGFKSRSYFSKVFSEYYGILPSDYRNKLKENNK